jgi:hypothetical protein
MCLLSYAAGINISLTADGVSVPQGRAIALAARLSTLS